MEKEQIKCTADQLVHAMDSCLGFLGAMQYIQNYYYCKWAVWHGEIPDRITVSSRINERAISTQFHSTTSSSATYHCCG